MKVCITRFRTNYYLLLLATLFFIQPVFSQSEAVPAYKLNKNLPVFKLETPGNTVYKSTQLKKNMPVIIMFFSPGCEHCIHQFEAMMKRMKELKKYQIVMPTFQPMEELVDFNKKYKLENYPNIVTGRDADYFFPPFYQISNFPYFAFYNKQGKLINTFEGNITVDNMLKRYK